MKLVSGGVCAAKGFKASGMHCGIRKNKGKNDLSMIVSSVPASAAAVYTINLVKGAPLLVTKEHLQNGIAQAIICNSGNANTCNANGVEIANEMAELTAEALHIQKSDVVVASTGVIGQPLEIAPIAAGIPSLAPSLSTDGSAQAALGIMTTDTVMKEVAVEFTLGDQVSCYAAKSTFRRYFKDIQHDQHRRRHFNQRYGRTACERTFRKQRDHRRERRFRCVYESAEHGQHCALQNHRR